MRTAEEVSDQIIIKFILEKGAQGSRNYFKCLRRTQHGVLVSRQSGSSYDVSKEYIIQAVEAVRKEPAIYQDGPSKLKPYINRWIYSPLWAMVRLLPIDEIMA